VNCWQKRGPVGRLAALRQHLGINRTIPIISRQVDPGRSHCIQSTLGTLGIVSSINHLFPRLVSQSSCCTGMPRILTIFATFRCPSFYSMTILHVRTPATAHLGDIFTYIAKTRLSTRPRLIYGVIACSLSLLSTGHASHRTVSSL
jgi:hypothetical protein